MTETNHAWIWIGHVTTTDGGSVAAFVIDERGCPDADATFMAAADELRQLGMAHKFKHVRIRRDEPTEPLPTWTEYRQSLTDSDT
ncbi:hypothetical protein CLV30_101426 [Haloactinopolyspora alba]|uniref:Uncharacterized protein n=1 Tax=Haloactinopolyspora alba TaxID=648780 RepID=A0A2P8EG88_9ACTN|nr:hypothetical protein [Haloactinopolyspora alba]PSL08454.1 hypothetical protein CLV30_101426 [Haloactinopolyspora alba]